MTPAGDDRPPCAMNPHLFRLQVLTRKHLVEQGNVSQTPPNKAIQQGSKKASDSRRSPERCPTGPQDKLCQAACKLPSTHRIQEPRGAQKTFCPTEWRPWLQRSKLRALRSQIQGNKPTQGSNPKTEHCRLGSRAS